MKNYMVVMWQLLTYFIIGIPLRIIFRVKRYYAFTYTPGKKYIIAANHPARIDPFLISYSLPLKEFVKLLPLRFITADEYMVKPFLRPFLLLYGCFTTKETKKGTVLQRAVKLMERGETVFIFPTGRIERKKSKYQAKVGVAYLNRYVDNSQIIPVHIQYGKKTNIVFKRGMVSKEKKLQKSADDIYATICRESTRDKEKLYELPWSMKNNPNGWIEPTTYCQLKCPGCYRGLAEKNPIRKHEEYSKLTKQVDWFIKHRNVQTISIAGGEPLCYPYLSNLIEYIDSKGLKSKIYTNGLALTKSKLEELKKAGATEFIIHVDKFQCNKKSEKEINIIREKFCNLFREIKGVNLGFIMPISKQNKDDLPILANFMEKNSDIINLVVFTVYKEMLPGKSISPELQISMEETSEEIKKAFGLTYCAYLGKKQSSGISWLFSLSAYSEGKLVGSFNSSFYKIIQDRYFKRKKKHFITVRNKPFKLSKLVPLLSNKSVRDIYLKSVGKNYTLNTQVVLIIDAPEKKGDNWNLCNGCPDAMLYEGKLVPSCLLERVKKGEKLETY